MYSAAVFGWPSTTIRPSRVMSRPTEIMLVAIAHVDPVRLVERRLEPPARLGDLVGRHARGQLDDLVERLAVGEQRLGLADPARARRSRVSVLRTSSSTIRRAPPSSRRLLK